MGKTVAAIDCGTNSTRLLIVDASGTALVRQMQVTRLGQGVDATHQLAPEAVARTLEVLRRFRGLMDQHQVEATRLVATSAVRDATNGEDYLRQATEVVGATAELLPGQEEGRLAYLGATSGLAASNGDTLVVDIGGGSTELVAERDGHLEAISLDMGCVRLSERFLQHDPPLKAEVAAAVAMIDEQLETATSAVAALNTLQNARLIGLAGTVSTLMAVELGLTAYDRAAVHHATLTRSAVERWTTTFAGETAAQRAERPGMLDGRQDVILGGALVLERVMQRFGFDQCLVSESDILDGLALSLLG
jgi:exopolyphosphatase/guanosine-5'-triphosphate,3'-diphosphate pyrophosphatase